MPYAQLQALGLTHLLGYTSPPITVCLQGLSLGPPMHIPGWSGTRFCLLSPGSGGPRCPFWFSQKLQGSNHLPFLLLSSIISFTGFFSGAIKTCMRPSHLRSPSTLWPHFPISLLLFLQTFPKASCVLSVSLTSHFFLCSFQSGFCLRHSQTHPSLRSQVTATFPAALTHIDLFVGEAPSSLSF